MFHLCYISNSDILEFVHPSFEDHRHGKPDGNHSNELHNNPLRRNATIWLHSEIYIHFPADYHHSAYPSRQLARHPGVYFFPEVTQRYQLLGCVLSSNRYPSRHVFHAGLGGISVNRATMDFLLVAKEDLAVDGHFMQCGLHLTSSTYQHRALHLHLFSADVPQYCDHAQDTCSNLCSVVLRADYDHHQTGHLGYVILSSLPVDSVFTLFCRACFYHELRLHYDFQSFSYTGEENAAQDWRKNQKVLPPKRAEGCQDARSGNGGFCALLVPILLSKFL